MVVAKLGQSSSNEVNDIQQAHFEVNSKIHEVLTVASLDVKRMLVSRLPAVIEEIKSEMQRKDTDI